MDLWTTFTRDEINAHLSLNYYLDAMSLKLFRIKYPTFCTVELSAMIASQDYLVCGYDGDFSHIEPLHAMDPNIFYSMLRYEAPKMFGVHQIAKIDYQKLVKFFTEGGSPISYSRD